MLQLFALVALVGSEPAGSSRPNVVLVIADDVGRDRLGCYGDAFGPSRTPTLDELAIAGVLFEHAWSNPLCSPTRATIATGRYSFRTGVGEPIGANNGYELDLEETTLPEVLALAGYTSVLLGKWHLTDSPPSALHAQLSGFAHHLGTRGNLADYDQWTKWIDGVPQPTNRYATTETIDDAIRMAASLPEPWFLWVGLHAAHKPFHAPPEALHGLSLSGSPCATAPDHHRAAVEAIDTELGRFLSALEPSRRSRTTIVFVGDNGTPTEALEPPLTAGKGSLTESGVRIPLIVSGSAVGAKGSRCSALVNTTDLFGTIADLAGIELADAFPDLVTDSVPLTVYLRSPDHASLRSTIYAERFENGAPNASYRRGMRGPRYKLVRVKELGQGGFGLGPTKTESFHDLRRDPLEQVNLLTAGLDVEQTAAYDALVAAMDGLVAP